MESPSLKKYEMILTICCGESVHENRFFEGSLISQGCYMMKKEMIRFGLSSLLRLGSLFLILVSPSFLYAVPANPEAADIEQPDGKKLKIHLRGDERFSWYEDEAGYVIKKDEKDKFWKFARPKKGSVDFDVIPDAIAGDKDPEKLNLKKGELPDKTLLREHIKKQWEPQVKKLTDSETNSLSKSPSPEGSVLSSVIQPPPRPIPVSGAKTVKNIVILACFNDHWDAVNNTVLASKGRTNVTEYVNLFNQVGHTNDNAVGSVKDYYLENSYGKLTVESVVTIWVRLPQNEAYYGAQGVYLDTNPQPMVSDAIAAADVAGFDFSQADGDGDGWADCLTIIHSGHGQEIKLNPTDCIWSHQWTMSSSVTYDGVKLYKYHTSPALRGLTSSTSIIRIGVICHEMGHFFGLPDLYDYNLVNSYSAISVGNWCEMSGGCWGGGDGKRPTHFSAWCKQALGFAVPKLIHSQTSLPLPDVKASDTLYMIRDGCSNEEYFLVENRNQTGFDASTPGRGIMIWHIDPKNANNDSSAWSHPLVKMEDANGDQVANEVASAWYSGNSGMIAGGLRDQTANSYTSAMRYQTGSYATRADVSYDYTYIRMNTFSAVGSNMTFALTTLIPTVSNQSTNTANYTVSWSASSDASKYEIQEGQLTNVTTFFEGFEDEDSLHDNWSLAGCTRSAAGIRTGTYSMLFSVYDGTDWWNSVQSLRSRNTVKFTASTTVQFYYVSTTLDGYGTFRFLVSKDNGVTWSTLWTHPGGTVSWTAVNITTDNLAAAGLSAGDDLVFNFVMNTEQASGLGNTFPRYGWGIDDFLVSNTSIPAYTNWMTLSNAVATASYGVTGKTNGTYAYRVRGYSNSIWQRYSPAAAVVVSGVPRDTKATVIFVF
jgi:M6 family metalloprotease-like protein